MIPDDQVDDLCSEVSYLMLKLCLRYAVLCLSSLWHLALATGKLRDTYFRTCHPLALMVCSVYVWHCFS